MFKDLSTSQDPSLNPMLTDPSLRNMVKGQWFLQALGFPPQFKNCWPQYKWNYISCRIIKWIIITCTPLEIWSSAHPKSSTAMSCPNVCLVFMFNCFTIRSYCAMFLTVLAFAKKVCQLLISFFYLFFLTFSFLIMVVKWSELPAYGS